MSFTCSFDVRCLYVVPANREYNAAYHRALSNAACDLQKWFFRMSGGYTFRLHDPIVEVVYDSHDDEWFNPPDHRHFDRCLSDLYDLINRGQLQGPIEKYNWMYCVDAQVAGEGLADPPVSTLPRHDLVGQIGQHPTEPNPYRWIGGFGHELGHNLGFTFHAESARSIMADGYLTYPNCNLTQREVNIVSGNPNSYKPSCRLVYLVPSDRNPGPDNEYKIRSAFKEISNWFGQASQLQRTPRLYEPCELVTVRTDHPADWYIRNPVANTPRNLWFYHNVLSDATRYAAVRRSDPNFRWLVFADAKMDADSQTAEVGTLVADSGLLASLGRRDEQERKALGYLAKLFGQALGLQVPIWGPANRLMINGYKNFPSCVLSAEEIGQLADSMFFPAPPLGPLDPR